MKTYQIMTNDIKQQKLWQTDEPGMHYTACYMPLILDACCGGRQFWFDKENPNVLFADQRVMEPKIVGSGKG